MGEIFETQIREYEAHIELKKNSYVRGSKAFLKYRDNYIFQFWKDKDLELFLQHIIKNAMYFLENIEYSGKTVFQDKYQIDFITPMRIDKDDIHYYYFKLCTGVHFLHVEKKYSALHRCLQNSPTDIVRRVYNTYTQGIDILKGEEHNMIQQEFNNLYYCYIGFVLSMEYLID
jgi:hypothetical protein